jgi:hypothetical protein
MIILEDVKLIEERDDGTCKVSHVECGEEQIKYMTLEEYELQERIQKFIKHSRINTVEGIGMFETILEEYGSMKRDEGYDEGYSDSSIENGAETEEI